MTEPMDNPNPSDQQGSSPPPPPPIDHDVPAGEKPPREHCTMGMLCHLLAFAGHIVPLGNIIGPLIIWLVKKDEMPFVDDQGRQSLNFQITVTLMAFGLGLLAVVTCGLGAVIAVPGIIALVIFDTVMIILATIKANDGIAYRYPLSIQFIK